MKKIDVLTYGRWSSAQQITSESIQDDIFEVHLKEEWLATLLGGQPVVSEHYKDPGKSASKKKSKRHDFVRLLDDVKGRHHGKPLLVINLSRLTRLHPSDALELFNTLKTSKTTVVSIDDRKSYKTDTLMELLEILIKSNDNHEYARNISKNCLRGQMKSILKGQKRGGTIPYGMAKKVQFGDGTTRVFGRNEKFLCPKDCKSWLVPGDEAELEAVRWIFNEFSTRQCSFGSLMRALNNHVNPLIRKGIRGKGWNVCGIIWILSNLHYAGWEFIGDEALGEHFRVGPNGDVVETKDFQGTTLYKVKTGHSPVVSPDLFDIIGQVLADRRKSGIKAKVGRDGEGYPLTGCVVCGNCGKSMYAHLDKGVVRYRCSLAGRNSSMGCGFWMVSQDELLPTVLGLLDKEVMSKLADRPQVATIANDQRANLEKELASTEKAISGITAKILAYPDLADGLTDDKIALLRKKKELVVALQSITTDNGQDAAKACEQWDALVKPMLIPVKTGETPLMDDSPISNEVAAEYDRLFNYTLVRPSVIRAQLHGMGLKIRLWFKPGGSGRCKWALDHGKVEAVLQGKEIGWNMSDSTC